MELEKIKSSDGNRVTYYEVFNIGINFIREGGVSLKELIQMGQNKEPITEDELLIENDQSWFWKPEWQEKERAADEDIKKGRLKEFNNLDEFLDSLDS